MTSDFCEYCGQRRGVIVCRDRLIDNLPLCSGCYADELERCHKRADLIAHYREQDARTTHQRALYAVNHPDGHDTCQERQIIRQEPHGAYWWVYFLVPRHDIDPAQGRQMQEQRQITRQEVCDLPQDQPQHEDISNDHRTEHLDDIRTGNDREQLILFAATAA